MGRRRFAVAILRQQASHFATHQEPNMRSFLVLASVVTAFSATTIFNATDANAVVCAAGVYRAGCAGARDAAVVVSPPVAACHYVIVTGVRVRRCV
jgi:hypothetical protein